MGVGRAMNAGRTMDAGRATDAEDKEDIWEGIDILVEILKENAAVSIQIRS